MSDPDITKEAQEMWECIDDVFTMIPKEYPWPFPNGSKRIPISEFARKHIAKELGTLLTENQTLTARVKELEEENKEVCQMSKDYVNSCEADIKQLELENKKLEEHKKEGVQIALDHLQQIKQLEAERDELKHKLEIKERCLDVLSEPRKLQSRITKAIEWARNEELGEEYSLVHDKYKHLISEEDFDDFLKKLTSILEGSEKESVEILQSKDQS